MSDVDAVKLFCQTEDTQHLDQLSDRAVKLMVRIATEAIITYEKRHEKKNERKIKKDLALKVLEYLSEYSPIHWEKISENSFIGTMMLPEHLDTPFDELWDIHPEEYGEVMIYGKLIKTPRWQQSYDQEYTFTGLKHDSLPLPDALKPYADWVNSLGLGEFTQKLINWYADGSHYIGAHSDSEAQLKPGSPIVSITRGVTRKFRLRLRKVKGIYRDIMISDRMVIIMAGDFQKELTHEIVKIGGKKGKKVGKRINITFRQFSNR